MHRSSAEPQEAPQEMGHSMDDFLPALQSALQYLGSGSSGEERVQSLDELVFLLKCLGRDMIATYRCFQQDNFEPSPQHNKANELPPQHLKQHHTSEDDPLHTPTSIQTPPTEAFHRPSPQITQAPGPIEQTDSSPCSTGSPTGLSIQASHTPPTTNSAHSQSLGESSPVHNSSTASVDTESAIFTDSPYSNYITLRENFQKHWKSEREQALKQLVAREEKYPEASQAASLHKSQQQHLQQQYTQSYWAQTNDIFIQIIRTVRTLLVHRSSYIRAASARVFKYLIILGLDRECWKFSVDSLLFRMFDIPSGKEKEQVLYIAHALCESHITFFPTPIIKGLMAVCVNSKDKFRTMALEILCNLIMMHPQIGFQFPMSIKILVYTATVWSMTLEQAPSTGGAPSGADLGINTALHATDHSSMDRSRSSSGASHPTLSPHMRENACQTLVFFLDQCYLQSLTDQNISTEKFQAVSSSLDYLVFPFIEHLSWGYKSQKELLRSWRQSYEALIFLSMSWSGVYYMGSNLLGPLFQSMLLPPPEPSNNPKLKRPQHSAEELAKKRVLYHQLNSKRVHMILDVIIGILKAACPKYLVASLIPDSVSQSQLDSNSYSGLDSLHSSTHDFLGENTTRSSFNPNPQRKDILNQYIAVVLKAMIRNFVVEVLFELGKTVKRANAVLQVIFSLIDSFLGSETAVELIRGFDMEYAKILSSCTNYERNGNPSGDTRGIYRNIWMDSADSSSLHQYLASSIAAEKQNNEGKEAYNPSDRRMAAPFRPQDQELLREGLFGRVTRRTRRSSSIGGSPTSVTSPKKQDSPRGGQQHRYPGSPARHVELPVKEDEYVFLSHNSDLISNYSTLSCAQRRLYALLSEVMRHNRMDYTMNKYFHTSRSRFAAMYQISHNKKKTYVGNIGTNSLDSASLAHLIKESQVPNKDVKKWRWDLIMELMRYRLPEHDKFLKRLLTFFRPKKKIFNTLAYKDSHMKYCEVGCQLLRYIVLVTYSGEARESSNTLSVQSPISMTVGTTSSASGVHQTLSQLLGEIIELIDDSTEEVIATTMTRTYFDMLGVLSQFPQGIILLKEHQVFRHMRSWIEDGKRDDIAQLCLKNLSYQFKDSPARNILTSALKTASNKTRYYATLRLKSLIQSVPDFSTWGMKLLFEQTHDQWPEVVKNALRIIHDACVFDTANLEKFLEMRPSIPSLILSDERGLQQQSLQLLYFILRSKKGLEYVEEQSPSFILGQLEHWKTFQSLQFTQQMEQIISRTVKSNMNKSTSFIRSHMRVTGSSSVQPNLYASLVHTKEGVSILRDSHHAHDYIGRVMHLYSQQINSEQRESISLYDVDISLRTALWMLGFIGQHNNGMELLMSIQPDILDVIIALAEESPLLSVRGITLYVISLFCRCEVARAYFASKKWRVDEKSYTALPLNDSKLFNMIAPEDSHSGVQQLNHHHFHRKSSKKDSHAALHNPTEDTASQDICEDHSLRDSRKLAALRKRLEMESEDSARVLNLLLRANNPVHQKDSLEKLSKMKEDNLYVFKDPRLFVCAYVALGSLSFSGTARNTLHKIFDGWNVTGLGFDWHDETVLQLMVVQERPECVEEVQSDSEEEKSS